MHEEILVVPTTLVSQLFSTEFGFVSNKLLPNLYTELIKNAFFVERGPAEINPSLRQLIPYVNIRFNNNIFVTERTSKQTEKRLHNKLSIGIGGHINPIDNVNKPDLIEAGMLREVEEEIFLPTIDRIYFKGYIFDNSSEVGLVHLGLLYEAWVSSNDVSIKETDKMNGWWVETNELPSLDSRLETWSKIASSQIKSNEIPIL
jgi:predicted NUDIX family phosphoesterase